MTTLILIGLVSGFITALSPCVLPVLPVVLASSLPGGEDGAGEAARFGWRRPVSVVAGLVLSFGLFTLVGGALLSFLHLPDDLLHWLGIVALALVGLGLMLPFLGHWLERPFYRVRMPRLNPEGNGFLLGMAFGLVFVPCAGPVLAAITFLAATHDVSGRVVGLTLAYCVGLAIPLTVFALAGDTILGKVRAVRRNLGLVRRIGGAVMVLTAVALVFNLAEPLQKATPSWLDAANQRIITNDDANAGLLDFIYGPVVGAAASFDQCAENPAELSDCGEAPDLTGITAWINSQPLTLDDLKGKVVLLDFWTYSCINCLRTLPYLTTWYQDYADDGLVVLGVHTPEFAFEKVERNVVGNAERLGVTYPVAMDNDYATWTAYGNRYWPAHYLIDQTGEVRQVHYGEGRYEETEQAIRQLLGLDMTAATAASTVQGDSWTPGQSPETYLGADRLGPLAQDPLGPGGTYAMPEDLALNTFGLGGTWTLEPEYAEAGEDAELRYRFHASKVFLVVEGEGTITSALLSDPSSAHDVEISGTPKLYTLYDAGEREDVLSLTFTPGLRAYAFTFG